MSTDVDSRKRDFEDIFIEIFQRLTKLGTPRSIAEARFDEQTIRHLKEQFSSIPVNPNVWLWDRVPRKYRRDIEASPNELFGTLLLVLAAEVCREEGREGAVWPKVRSLVPSNYQTELFPGGQPSPAVKQAIADGARRLDLRRAIGWYDSQEYFNTVKLQFGFTLRGARQKLAYWLVGVGEPVVVRALRGEDPDHPEAESSSFRHLWFALQNYRRNHLGVEETKRVLEESPWVRTHWIPDLLRQARAHLERLGCGEETLEKPGLPTEVRTALPAALLFEWDRGEPELRLRFDEEAVHEAVEDWRATRIQFLVDGEPILTWIRQGTSWRGHREGTLSNWDASALTIVSGSGRQSLGFDLAEFGLREEVLIFEMATGRLLGPRESMDRRREYAIICDDALTVGGYTSSTIQHRHTQGRNVYRIGAGWVETLQLELDGLVYWEPSVREGREAERLNIVVSNLTENPASLGEESPLLVTGVPKDALEVSLLIGKQRKEFEVEHTEAGWCTRERIALKPPLLLGTEGLRVRVRTERSNRCWKPIVRWNVVGVALLEENAKTGQPSEWKSVPTEKPLDIAGGRQLARLFLPAGETGTRLMEGPRVIGRGVRAFSLSLCGGWGEALGLGNGRFRRLAYSVVDRGVVRRFYGKLLGRPCYFVLLNSSIEPSARHSVVLWGRDDCVRRVRVKSHNLRDCRWVLEPYEEPRAWAIAYDGESIGRDWRFDELRDVLSRRPRAETFALLRWFKAPILGPDLRSAFCRAAVEEPVDFLNGWYANRGLAEGLRAGEDPEEILFVVRAALWKAHLLYHAQAEQILKLIMRGLHRGLEEHSEDTARVTAVKKLAEICPPFVWAVLIRVRKGPKLARLALRETVGVARDATRENLESGIRRMRTYCAQSCGLAEDTIGALTTKLAARLEHGGELNEEEDFVLRRVAETLDGGRYLAAVVLRTVANRGR